MASGIPAPCSAADPLDLAAFDAVGMLHVPGFVPPDLLALLRQGVDRMVASLPMGTGTYFSHAGDGSAHRVARVCGVAGNGPLPELLVLLGSPLFQRLMVVLCGHDAIITQTDLLIRYPDDGAPINWHQDAVIAPGHRWVALGLALDDTRTGDGDLLGVAGSHHGAQDIAALEQAHGWEPPGLVHGAPKAGDLVMHHVMLVHGSFPPMRLARRRTLYVYVDSATRIARAEPANAGWAVERHDLTRCARQAWQSWYAGDISWQRMRWPDAAPEAPRQTVKGGNANYAVRHQGRLLGNSYDLFHA